MSQNAVTVKELVKQIAVWLGIWALLPLAVWYGTSVFSPPPDWKSYAKSNARLNEKIQNAKVEADKENLRQEQDRLEKEQDAEERVFYGNMFWVAYPVGLLAIVIGIFYPVQVVGAGLMFGGLSSLGMGCYSYWDRMDVSLQFASLLVVFVLLLILGTWRFRSERLHSAASLNE